MSLILSERDDIAATPDATFAVTPAELGVP